MKFLAGLIACLPVAWSQPCAPRLPLHPTDSVNGTLDQTNCTLSDGTAHAEYVLVLPARGNLHLNGASAAFTLSLILRDANFHQLASGAAISLPAEQGQYFVLVNAAAPGQLGAFTLSSSFTPQAGTICRGFAPIGLNQSVTGRLGPASCALPDGTPYDGYTLNSFGAGNLSVTLQSGDFDGYLILRSSDGFELASADAGGAGGSAQIVTDIEGASSYTIVASAGDGASGAYSLNVSFTPADTEACRSLQTIRATVPAGSASGTVSAQDAIAQTGCVYPAADPNAHIVFNYYDLQVTQAGLARIQLSTTDFSPYLQLLDASGALIEGDAYSGGFGTAVIAAQLAPGNYTIQAFSLDAPGAYKLQYTFTPLGPGGPAVCPSLQADAGATLTGSFSSTACRTVEGPAQVYNVAMPADGTLDIDMQSTDFVPLLTLRDAKDNRIVNDDNFGNITDSHITADLPAGNYSVVAATGGLPGSYTFTYTVAPHSLAPCTQLQSLDLNSAYVGVFGAANCRGANGQPVDYYQITTPAGGTLAAVMTSPVIDSLLALQTGDGSGVLRWDNNSYSGSNALLVEYLPAGTYRLAAQATDAVTSGYYQVNVLFAAGAQPGCAPLSSITPGATIQGSLSFTSCMYPDSTFADIYQLSLSDITALDLRLDSSAFDAYLVVLDAKGNVVDADDNSDGGSNARITDTFDPGMYYVVAKPFSSFSSSGAYVLTVNPAQ